MKVTSRYPVHWGKQEIPRESTREIPLRFVLFNLKLFETKKRTRPEITSGSTVSPDGPASSPRGNPRSESKAGLSLAGREAGLCERVHLAAGPLWVLEEEQWPQSSSHHHVKQLRRNKLDFSEKCNPRKGNKLCVIQALFLTWGLLLLLLKHSLS